MHLLSSTVSSAESLLQPYLAVTLALTQSPLTTPLFTTFYIQHAPPPPLSTNNSSSCTFLVVPPPSNLLPEYADSAATNAETTFWEAVSILKTLPRHRDNESLEIDSFWPSQKSVVEEEVDE
jgi:hypothetical protein